ncbi:TraX family protein [Anaerosporobacter faecicola]|uniref:TraX family protein n=1 Tax=Anaerosporobacter faecicola TaxID=2718714 RepID=UPI00143C335A|nr:TraX family protein [Anaerosporobacter faecicola]
MEKTGFSKEEKSGYGSSTTDSFKTAGLTANMIKVIAIVAMVIDHITWKYIPTASLQGQLLHVIGRLTAPIMAFFVAEGFYHTRNLKRYVLRMFVFSLISYLPYQFYEYGELFHGLRGGSFVTLLTNSVIFSLLLGLLSLVVWYKTNWKRWIKITAVGLLCIMASTSDWALIDVLWVFFIGINHGNFKEQMKALAAVGLITNGSMILVVLLSGDAYWWQNLCQLGVIGAIPVLSLYNGKLGKSKNMKWLFYIFYPLHLTILAFIRFCL